MSEAAGRAVVGTGPFHVDGRPVGIFIENACAFRFAATLARFIQNPCQLSRDAQYLVQLAELAELLLSAAPDGTKAEELRRLIQSRVMR